MASIYVLSLHTNTPLSEYVDLCCNLFFKNYYLMKYDTCISNRDQYEKLLSFVVNDNHIVSIDNATIRFMELL